MDPDENLEASADQEQNRSPLQSFRVCRTGHKGQLCVFVCFEVWLMHIIIETKDNHFTYKEANKVKVKM